METQQKKQMESVLAKLMGFDHKPPTPKQSSYTTRRRPIRVLSPRYLESVDSMNQHLLSFSKDSSREPQISGWEEEEPDMVVSNSHRHGESSFWWNHSLTYGGGGGSHYMKKCSVSRKVKQCDERDLQSQSISSPAMGTVRKRRSSSFRGGIGNEVWTAGEIRRSKVAKHEHLHHSGSFEFAGLGGSKVVSEGIARQVTCQIQGSVWMKCLDNLKSVRTSDENRRMLQNLSGGQHCSSSVLNSSDSSERSNSNAEMEMGDIKAEEVDSTMSSRSTLTDLEEDDDDVKGEVKMEVVIPDNSSNDGGSAEIKEDSSIKVMMKVSCYGKISVDDYLHQYFVDVVSESGVRLNEGKLDNKVLLLPWEQQVVDPLVFEKLEKVYGNEKSWGRSERKLVFDQINCKLGEVLDDQYRQVIMLQGWRSKVGVHSVVREEELWREFLVGRSMNQSSNGYEEVVGKERDWVKYSDEGICLIVEEIEKFFVDELIEEIIAGII